jgi:hypothetical protein
VASKPIRIEFVAEVAQYLRDTKKLEVSTEDIADALNATTKNADDLERKLGKAMKGAEKDAESLKRVLDDLPESTGKAAKAADDDFRKIGDDAKEAGREAGDEFKQNLGESLASGDLGDVFADTIGGLISSLKGPLGVAAAAVGGTALIVFNKVKADWDALVGTLEASAQSVLDKQLELGKQYLSQQERLQIIADLVKEQPDVWRDIEKQAKLVGVSMEDVGLAVTGSKLEQAELTAELQKTVAEGIKLVNTGRGYYTELTPAAEAAKRLMELLAQAGKTAEDDLWVYRTVNELLGAGAGEAERMKRALQGAREAASGIQSRRLVGAGQVGII